MSLSGIREIIFGKRTAEFPLPKSLNGKFDSLPPVEGQIFEFVFDFKARGQCKHWNDIIKNMEIEDLYNFQDVLVPTIDSSGYCHKYLRKLFKYIKYGSNISDIFSKYLIFERIPQIWQ